MPFLNANNMIGYLSSFRVCHIDGRYGGGKTALAFRLAYELQKMKRVRYIISNVQSVFADDPAKVVLREGRYADVAMVLDEGGIFVKSGAEAEQYMAFMRKINAILIIPSVLEPALKTRFLTVQRLQNLNTIGLPVWIYSLLLRKGMTYEKQMFYWLNPHEIFGLYDTEGFPVDDDGLLKWIKTWTAQAADNLGYKAAAAKVLPPAGAFTMDLTNEPISTQENNNIQNLRSPSENAGQTGDDSSRVLDEIRGLAQSIDESTAVASLALSISQNERGHSKRRR